MIAARCDPCYGQSLFAYPRAGLDAQRHSRDPAREYTGLGPMHAWLWGLGYL